MKEVAPSIAIIVTSLASIVQPGFYGVLGSAGFYIHEIIQDPSSFSWITLLMYCFLGFVIGVMVHNMTLDLFNSSYPGLLIASGFSVRKMTEIANKYVGFGLKLPKK